MKGMRYKNFKKIHEDAHTATLQHPEGHTIKIAKGALSDHIKKQLGALPFAEKQEMQHLYDGGYASAATGEEQGSKKADQILKGSKDQAPPTADQQRQHQQVWKGSTYSHSLALPSGMADGGEVQDAEDGSEAQNVADFYGIGNAQAPSGMQQPAPIAEATSQAVPEPTNPNLPPQQQTTFVPSAPLSNPIKEGMEQMQSGIQGLGAVESKAAKKEALMAAENTTKLENLNKMHQENLARVQGEIDNVIGEVRNGKIDPNHFWANRSLPGKFATGIGLILGGMGSGVTGGPNPVLQDLNASIDRDVEAQKANMANKVTALHGLQQQFGNINDAANILKAMQAGVFASQLMEAAAKSKDPAAILRAKIAGGEVLAKYGPAGNQAALSQTIMQGVKQGTVPVEMAITKSGLVPEHAQKDALKAAGEIRTMDALRDHVHAAQQEIHNKFLNGTLSPNDTESAKQIFIGKIIKETEGRFNFEAATNLANAMYPAKTDLGKKTFENKMRRTDELFDDMTAGSRSLLSAYGLSIPKNSARKFHK